MRAKNELRRAVDLRIERLFHGEWREFDTPGELVTDAFRQLCQRRICAAEFLEICGAQRAQAARLELELGAKPVDGSESKMLILFDIHAITGRYLTQRRRGAKFNSLIFSLRFAPLRESFEDCLAQFGRQLGDEARHRVAGEPFAEFGDDAAAGFDGHFEVGRTRDAVELVQVVGHHAVIDELFAERGLGGRRVVDAAEQHGLIQERDAGVGEFGERGGDTCASISLAWFAWMTTIGVSDEPQSRSIRVRRSRAPESRSAVECGRGAA